MSKFKVGDILTVTQGTIHYKVIETPDSTITTINDHYTLSNTKSGTTMYKPRSLVDRSCRLATPAELALYGAGKP